MSEVSCRAFQFYVLAEREGLCSIPRLLDGSSLTRAQLERPGGRVPWDEWSQIVDRFAESLGSDRALAESCRFALNEQYIGSLSRIGREFVEPRLFFRVTALWLLQGMYRLVRFSVTELDAEQLRVEAHLLPGFRPSRAWFLLLAHSVLRAPTFLGMPAVTPSVFRVDDHSAVLVVPIAHAPRRPLWERARSLWRSSDVLASELVAQQTELTRAFEDMRQTTTSFQNVLDALPLAIAVIQDGGVRYANPSLAALVGVSVGQLRGRALAEFAHADDVATVSALERGQRSSGRVRLVPRGREEVLLDAQSVCDIAFDGATCVVVIGVDVSHQERTRARLERSEATTRLLVSTQPEIVVRFDRSLRIQDVQPGHGIAEGPMISNLLGASLEQLAAWVSPRLARDFPAIVEQYEAAIAQGGVFERSVRARGASGEPREFHVRCTPVMDGAESILVIRDETERRAVERRLALAEHMGSLGLLTAGVAHEINNPLTYVALSVDALEEELRSMPAEHRARIQELVVGLRDGTDRIRATVSRMKGMSRVTSGERKPVWPRAALETALSITAHETSRRARVIVEAQDTRAVSADETELGQVFINLIINAAQALDGTVEPPSGGHVIRIRLFEEGPAVVFECEDTGEGIAPDRVERIFDPFYTTKERKHGTGLGLAIVHRIVQEIGGAVDVRTLVGRGSTFRVTLPATAASAAARPPADPVEPSRAKARARVYVVDDEPMIGRAVARILRGHELSVFGLASDALEALGRGEPPDLVLCDLEMPGMNGIQLYEQAIARQPQLRSRFVFLTGGAFTGQAVEFVQRPDVRVMDKPVPAPALRTLVADMLGARTAAKT